MYVTIIHKFNKTLCRKLDLLLCLFVWRLSITLMCMQIQCIQSWSYGLLCVLNYDSRQLHLCSMHVLRSYRFYRSGNFCKGTYVSKTISGVKGDAHVVQQSSVCLSVCLSVCHDSPHSLCGHWTPLVPFWLIRLKSDAVQLLQTKPVYYKNSRHFIR